MDDIRRVRRVMTVGVVVALAAAVLSLAIGKRDVAAMMVVGTAAAGFLYWLAPRYPGLFQDERESDTDSTRTAVASLLDLFMFCLATAGLAFAWSSIGLVAASSLTTVPDATQASLLAALVGIFVGGAVPLLAERRIAFHRFRGPLQGETAGQVLRMGTAVLVLLVVPRVLLSFLAVFVASRLLVLCWSQFAGR